VFCRGWNTYDYEVPTPDIVFTCLPHERADDETLRKAVDSLTWFCGRYVELCLFRYLQHASNNPSEAIEVQKEYISSILCVLMATNEDPTINFASLTTV